MNHTNAEAEEPYDLSSLWADLQDLEDNSITPDRREALMDLINRSSQARSEYFEYFHQTAVLRMEAAKASENVQMARTIIPVRIPKWWEQPWVATAAVLTVAALIGALVLKQHFGPDRMRAVAAEPSQWEINGVRQTWTAQGTQVKAGDSIHLISGLVKLELASGSIIVMQGPSKVTFPESRKPILQDGLLWIDTGQTDDSFEVSTPELVVKDIGTRFGVRIGECGRSEVHLMEGGVNVLSQESGIKLATLAPNGKGRAIAADGTSQELPLADDPFPMLQSLLSGATDYGKEIIAQKPSGYWKFDSAVDGLYDNEIRGHGKAKSGPSVSIHPVGVNEDDRFQGFDSSNNSLYFPASEYKKPSTSVIAFLDGENGVSRHQGAMTFWIKQVEGTKEDQVLWLAGSNANPIKGAPTDSLAHSYLTPSGRIVFSIDDKEQDVALESSQAIEQGRWHHIGISWAASNVTLYVDGKRVAHRSDVRSFEKWTSNGNFVRFGKPTNNMDPKKIKNFHGWLDEYALWNRPLTPDEVDQQFRAAIGRDAD